MQKDSTPAIKATIKDYKVEIQGNNQRVFFNITIEYNGYDWMVAKRYSDFEEI